MTTPSYRVRFTTQVEVIVTIAADDEDAADDDAWPHAEEYLQTVTGNGRNVTATASLDGVGADEVTGSASEEAGS
jgi:hypothetical protein